MNRLRQNRKWVLLAVTAVSIAMVWAIQVRGWYVTHPARDIIIAIGIINLMGFCWIRACSGFPLIRQASIVTAVVAAQAVCVGLLRIDGYHGDGRLIVKWKWQPTQEEMLESFVEKTDAELPMPNFSVIEASDSPAFRGVHGDGKFIVKGMTKDWNSAAPKELWRRPIGRGWSSFVATGDHCLTQELRGENETIVCYHMATGQVAWTRAIDKKFQEVTSGAGPRSTPTISDGNVYALSSLGKVHCLRGTDGTPIWERDLRKPDADPILFGFCGSPLVYGDFVFVMLGGAHGSIVALDRQNGNVAWASGKRRGSYSSPVIFQADGQGAVIIHDAVGLFAYAIETGEQLCEFKWGRDSEDRVNACQPAIVDSEHILLSSGYGVGSVLIRLQRQDDTTWHASEVWRSIQLKSKFQSVLVHEGYAYGLDEGILTCIDLRTGERTWKKGRHRYGQLILVNDCLVIQSESGEITIADADPTRYKPIATLDALSDRTWNHPTVARGRLLVRNDREAICFQLPIQR